MKILLVVINASTSTQLADIVSQCADYQMVTANTEEQAWQTLHQSKSPWVVIIEHANTTPLNSSRLCARLRQLKPEKQPFIILLVPNDNIPALDATTLADSDDIIAANISPTELNCRLDIAQRFIQLRAQLNKIEGIFKYERRIIEDILLNMRHSKPFASQGLRVLEVPVERISGDILLSAFKEDGTHHILLGDFTGHGLIAAVNGPVVHDIFYSMTVKGFSLLEIAEEINRQLIIKLPTGIFLCCILLELSANRRSLSISNCGMSEVFIFHGRSYQQSVTSNLMALGIIDQHFEETVQLSVDAHSHIYAFSDGLTEAANSRGEEFGQARLQTAIHDMLDNCADIYYLFECLKQFCGDQPMRDDITLLELSC